MLAIVSFWAQDNLPHHIVTAQKDVTDYSAAGSNWSLGQFADETPQRSSDRID